LGTAPLLGALRVFTEAGIERPADADPRQSLGLANGQEFRKTCSETDPPRNVVTVAGPVAGTPLNIMVQALDESDNPVPGYVGAMHFTITDGPTVLIQDYTLTAADAGTHAFAVTLTTAGA
jgi:hypothetical protein